MERLSNLPKSTQSKVVEYLNSNLSSLTQESEDLTITLCCLYTCSFIFNLNHTSEVM